MGRAESQNLGMAGIPIVVIPHPLAGNRPDEVERKAAAIADEVVAILTRPAEKLVEEYRGRFRKPAGKRINQSSA